MVILSMSVLEARIRDVSIYLCRRDTRMAEHFLDRAYVGTVCQEGRREGVAECVSGDILDDIRPQGVLFDHRRDMDAGEAHL